MATAVAKPPSMPAAITGAAPTIAGKAPGSQVPANSANNTGTSGGTTMFSFKIISIAAAGPPVASKPPAGSEVGKDGKPQNAAPASNQPVKAAVLTNLPYQSANSGMIRNEVTLAQIKARLKQLYPAASAFNFCNEEGAVAPDTLNLNAYFAHLKTPPTMQDTTLTIYVTATVSPATLTSTSIALLLQRDFLLKSLRILDSTNSNIEGSISSSVFKGKNPATTTLGTLRDFIKSMSVDARQDTFCLPDGTPVQDGITLEQYLVTAQPRVEDKDKVVVLPLFIKKNGMVAIQPTGSYTGGGGVGGNGGGGGYGARGGGLGGGMMGGYGGGAVSQGPDQAVLNKLGPMDLSFTNRQGQELRVDKTNLQVTETLIERNYAASGAGTMAHAGKLNEAEWDIILRNCNALCGWIIDFNGNRIVRAPHAAFQLRKGLNLERVKFKVEPPAQPQQELAKTPAQVEDAAKSSTDKHEEDSATPENSEDKTEKSKEDKVAPPLKSEDAPEYVPKKPHGIPSFAVTDDSNIEVVSMQHEFSQSLAENHFDKTTFEVEASGVIKGITVGAQAGMAKENESGSSSSKKSINKTLAATYRIPRVTVYLPAEDLEPTEEFATAIANIRETKNIYDLRKLHKTFGQIFCSEIVLGGCLQTFKTLSADESKDESMTRNKFKGSVGLAVGVPKIASGSAKATHETQDMQEQAQREFRQRENLSFNATGGNTILAADPPAWLGSVGSDFHSWRVIQQTGIVSVIDTVSAIKGYQDVGMWFLQAVPKLTEYIVIPPSRTLDARFKVLFQLEGLSRALASLKVGRDNEKVESKNEDVGLSKNTKNTQIQTYLAHSPSHPPKYIRTFVSQKPHAPDATRSAIRSEGGRLLVDVTTKIYQTVNTSTHAVFQPASTQAPVLIDPRALPVDPSVSAPPPNTTTPGPVVPAAPAIDTSNKSLAGSLALPSSLPLPTVDKRTVWRLEVPYGYSLTNNSLVTIRSLAPSTPSSTTGGSSSLQLTVYRNHQGSFLPTITSAEDPIYWRIQQLSSSTPSGQIRYGDPVRLVWRFSDQASGWRDYKDDYYGRRRFDRPLDLSIPGGDPSEGDALYLKAPFPRFEALDDPQGMALIMSPASTTQPILQSLTLREPNAPAGVESVAYNLFDLSFRLDYVAGQSGGEEEAFDYMNVVQYRGDDTYTSEEVLVREWTEAERQSVLDVGGAVVKGVVGKYTGQFDNIVNAASTGSPGGFVKEVFKGALMLNPIGGITKILGFW